MGLAGAEAGPCSPWAELNGAFVSGPEPYVRVQNGMFWFSEFLQSLSKRTDRMGLAMLNHAHMLASLGEP